ncbi:sulfate adenylyltransferase subunit CysD [Alphaproteobacteria bacterium]|nr:sulfate adenylyltransferase subunit CysD [Alphaproteobacteria bacterium]
MSEKNQINTNRDKLNNHLLTAKTNMVLTIRDLCVGLFESETGAALKKMEREMSKHHLLHSLIEPNNLKDEHGRPAKRLVTSSIFEESRKKRHLILFSQLIEIQGCPFQFYHDARGSRRWVRLENKTMDSISKALQTISDREGKAVVILPVGELVSFCRTIVRKRGIHLTEYSNSIRIALDLYHHSPSEVERKYEQSSRRELSVEMTHLDKLEAESIHIIREAISEAMNPVMLYSMGKDSSVMLHLARKAFYPSPPPFPLLHVDTRWNFQAMYDFRDYMAQESGMDLLVYVNSCGVAKNINPFDHGSALHSDIMKTESLSQALDHYRFDVAFGGARRDEKKIRAKERVFSFRTALHRWDPENQRPELWNLYTGIKNSDESIRVFPISNWTELDIWQYIYREQIPIVPLYFAAERPVIERDGILMMVDDDRLPLHPDEQIHLKKIRFRTLGCYPLTGAIESEADDLASIVLELLSARTSERQGFAIVAGSSASMEKKKQEGYFK